jgi:hypothetical protein
MSWLLFLDESGHDHREVPYEIHGGVALHASKLWDFVQGMGLLEVGCFDSELSAYGKECKGSKLLSRDVFRWAGQGQLLEPARRRKLCKSFLTKGPATPTREEFTAYGQACLEMARGVFGLLRASGAVLFAAAIPRAVVRPAAFSPVDYLRKDHVFLLERYFSFLEQKQEFGLLVHDEVEKAADRRFVAQLGRYFRQTQTGRLRSRWIVPTPLFVASDMSAAVQAADVAIYCLNWGFRLPSLGMNAPTRIEIEKEFGRWLPCFSFTAKFIKKAACTTATASCTWPTPTRAGGAHKKGDNAFGAPLSRDPASRISIKNIA